MTLPKALRKILGVDQGGVVMADLSEKGLVLHPAVAYPIEMYTADRIAQFDAADRELGKALRRKRK
jgi:antitoxin component of MazEF toxin-antitoxin module